jgi:hypothetical protein
LRYYKLIFKLKKYYTTYLNKNIFLYITNHNYISAKYFNNYYFKLPLFYNRLHNIQNKHIKKIQNSLIILLKKIKYYLLNNMNEYMNTYIVNNEIKLIKPLFILYYIKYYYLAIKLHKIQINTLKILKNNIIFNKYKKNITFPILINPTMNIILCINLIKNINLILLTKNYFLYKKYKFNQINLNRKNKNNLKKKKRIIHTLKNKKNIIYLNKKQHILNNLNKLNKYIPYFKIKQDQINKNKLNNNNKIKMNNRNINYLNKSKLFNLHNNNINNKKFFKRRKKKQYQVNKLNNLNNNIHFFNRKKKNNINYIKINTFLIKKKKENINLNYH